jgi:hypothetical protein
MKRGHAAIVASVFALALGGAVLAQGVQSDIAVGRSDIQADRQAIVAHNMKLTDAQATAFWPVYREYHNELAKNGDRLVNLVTQYGTAYGTLTDEQATTMTKEYISIQQEKLKVTEKFIPKFDKALPPKLVMRYLQIENKLDVILMTAAVDGIPLAK